MQVYCPRCRLVGLIGGTTTTTTWLHYTHQCNIYPPSIHLSTQLLSARFTFPAIFLNCLAHVDVWNKLSHTIIHVLWPQIQLNESHPIHRASEYEPPIRIIFKSQSDYELNIAVVPIISISPSTVCGIKVQSHLISYLSLESQLLSAYFS